MSLPSGWICAQCQKHLRTRAVPPLGRQKRSFTSSSRNALSKEEIDQRYNKPRRDRSAAIRLARGDIPIAYAPSLKWRDKASRSEGDHGRRGVAEREAASPAWQSRKSLQREAKDSESSEGFFNQLFKSSGREFSAESLTLRYSNRKVSSPSKRKANAGQVDKELGSQMKEPESTKSDPVSLADNGTERDMGMPLPAPRTGDPLQLETTMSGDQDHAEAGAAMADEELDDAEFGPIIDAEQQGVNARKPQKRAKGLEERKLEKHLEFERGLLAASEKLDLEEQPLVRSPGETENETEKAYLAARWNTMMDFHPMFNIAKASRWHGYMRKHIKLKDLGRGKTIWRNYEMALLEGKGPKDPEAVFTDLTLFLNWAVTGKLTSEAIKIWHTMKKYGFELNLRHWTMMLKLAGSQRDSKLVSAVWHGIEELGEPPDNRTWSVLLSSTVSCAGSRWKDFCDVCDEMHQQWNWLESREGKHFLNNIEPQERRALYGPSVVPYNAGLSRMINSGRTDDAQRLLNLMNVQGILPSVYTFNTMLQPAARLGDLAAIRRLMSEMRQRDVKPDKVTFTQVLDGMVRHLSLMSESKTEPQVIADIEGFFNDMGAEGYVPYLHTYATALSALLLRSEPIVPAAVMVMKHMEAHNVQPNVYIYTILVEYYMREDNPQIAAAEAIYRRVRERRLVVDHRFYDSMIQGYATCGETDKMLRMIRFVPRTGHKLSWSTMTAAVHLLVANNEIGIATELVEDLEVGRGMGRLGCHNPSQGAVFWSRVDGLRERGLLPRSSVSEPMYRNSFATDRESWERGLNRKSELKESDWIGEADAQSAKAALEAVILETTSSAGSRPLKAVD